MYDLRGNWGFDYPERMREVRSLLETLIEKDSENKEKYQEDLEVTNQELEDRCDGRIFRDFCKLYNYISKEGSTQQVKYYLDGVLSYPEDNNIKSFK